MLILEDETTLCIIFRVSFHSCIVKISIFITISEKHFIHEAQRLFQKAAMSSCCSPVAYLKSLVLSPGKMQLSPSRQGQRWVNTSGYLIN